VKNIAATDDLISFTPPMGRYWLHFIYL
jgi:hypothetical protein